MKKFGYLMGAALLTLGSCTNEINEEGFVDKANTISFSAYSNKTRAAYTSGDIDDATAMRDGSFGVVGYKTGSSIYLGSATKAIEQTWQSSAWGYATSTDLKYWPKENMDFYAYFPYASSGDTFAESTSAESTSADGTVMTINHATGNQDVLFASAIDQGYQERVPLTFYHAFSKINSVKIKVELNDVDVEVKTVEFINTKSSDNSQVLVDRSGKASYGTSTGSSCGTTLNDAETISTTSNPNGYTIWSGNANKYILATNGTEINNVKGTNKAMWDGAKSSLEGGNLSTKGLVCLKITGKIKTHGGTNYIIGTEEEDGDIYIPLKGDLASVGQGDISSDLERFFAGKRYTYNIVMSKNVGFKDNGDPILKPILFNVSSVTGWDDVTVNITL